MKRSFLLKATAILAGAAAVVLLWFLFPVKGKPVQTAVDPAFAEFIASYSGGVLTSGSVIRIVFARDAVDSTRVGQDDPRNLFGFSPGVKGKVRWLDTRTVEFRPDGRWPAGTRMEGRFRLGELFDVPANLRVFIWNFQIIGQYFDVTIENVLPYVKSELTRLKIEGYMQTADFAPADAVEKTLTAIQHNTPLQVSWHHTDDGLQHHFSIENVQRREEAGKVEIKVNGEPIQVKNEIKKEVEIPPLADFRIMEVRVEQGPAQHVVIRFSDPLSESQNLQGLITLASTGTPEYQIEQNLIRVYPSARQTGNTTLTVEAGIRNAAGTRLKDKASFNVTFEELKPAVRFAGRGTILPDADGLVLPFEAVNLRSVDVQVVRIFENNILQFLQVNDLSGNSELRRVGRPVLRKTVSLETAGVADLGKWNRFTLDLTSLINPEPGAIYQVSIGFRKSQSAYYCPESTDTKPEQSFEEDNWNDTRDFSYWDSYEEYYYDEDYDWYQRNNPCHASYYTGERTIRKNILASNLGIIAKMGSDGSVHAVVTDLKTTLPIAGAAVEVYNYQQQRLGSGTTRADGTVILPVTDVPFALIARHGNQRSYLKLSEGNALSLSHFDVGGQHVEKALKGYLYGERGVWRPGDSIYLTFVLEDRLKQLPAHHPVVMELQNPFGQITSRLVRSKSENGFYSFTTATGEDAPTGTWTARVKVGGLEFRHPLKIETVKPNRLKIKLDFGKDKLKAPLTSLAGNLSVSWLHGAPARNLQAQFEVLFNPATLTFPNYSGFQFNDPSLEYYPESKPLFEGYTDASGNALIDAAIEIPQNPPALINAIFRGRVYEESGNFSIDQFALPLYPYEAYVGLRLPPGDRARNMLLTDTTHRVDIVTVDADGNPLSRSRIQVALYKLNWSWWWDNTENNAVYKSFTNARELSRSTIQTRYGKGSWTFKIKYPDWGRYLVKVTDELSGHSAAQVVYVDWPGWAGRARPGADGASVLSFASDKPAYSIGEKATIVIPGSAMGRAWISLENGSRVLQTHWVETQAGDTPFQFDVTPEMAPNIYVHITLIQPHGQTFNDVPIRLYGVIPVLVEDPKTHLEPVIETSQTLEPGREVRIRVSEKNNRPMTYTLAMVDEGLLDLTHFKTPDLWSVFYAREALGVKTWDLYNDVIGSYGGRVERLLAIGGDADALAAGTNETTNRFKPVVKFIGPVTLKGGKNEHRFVMPNYVGSVRLMVVAGYNGAYGSASKAVPVKKPLMVLTTLPRVLGPEEQLKLPVTLFAMEKSIRQVKVEVKARGPVRVNQSVKMVDMIREDLTVDFDMEVLPATGKATLELTATSGNISAGEIIHIEVRNPNSPVTRVTAVVVDAGKKWQTTYLPHGIPGTNRATLEVSSLPPLNLEQRLGYLLQYPYGCLEQTVSAAFPQLYLTDIMELQEAERNTIQNHLRAAIDKIKFFRQGEGGFSLWPGREEFDSWATSYAGHFLLEALRRGYPVSDDLLKEWRHFQKKRAQAWKKGEEPHSSELIQAYRLYTLTLAGAPELGAMNRLREQVTQNMATWMLAAAYARAGQPEAARKLVDKQPVQVKPYREMGWSYGSDLRDKAIILETLLLLNEREKAFTLVQEISQALSNGEYALSTQTTAWCLKAVVQFAAGARSQSLQFGYTFNGQTKHVETRLPYARINLGARDARAEIQVVNTTGAVLFARLIAAGTPARGEEKEEMRNLSIKTEYLDLQGRPINVSKLEQGTQFVASVTVLNQMPASELRNLALTRVFPSGWEITNLRLEEAESLAGGNQPDYQDVRDDRVYTYFSLRQSERKTFRVLLTATYAGTYYLPAVSCEAMYNPDVYARDKGMVVQVVKPVLP
ncbi:MAG: hypothetical protein KatS3mg032_1963 [Cyclobacteriaceae bacterium]|nr:MAG: hypothetical protein KatS3mg032_1963 [Cyclobacteriaceae bacterium]